MPAPAVIPAPKAYINAVAVKGFVVELRVEKKAVQSVRTTGGPLRFRLVNTGNEMHGSGSFPITACHACWGAPVILL